MVICNIQSLWLKSFVDTTLQCIGQSEKFKASDEGNAYLCNSTFLYLKTGKINFGKYTKSTLRKNLAYCKLPDKLNASMVENTLSKGQIKSSEIQLIHSRCSSIYANRCKLTIRACKFIWHYVTANKSHTFQCPCDIMIANTQQGFSFFT